MNSLFLIEDKLHRIYTFITFSSYEKISVLCEKSLPEFLSNHYVLRPRESEKTFFLFQTDLQISFRSFFHRSYIFFLLMKNVFKNKNFWFSKKLYEIRKKC